MVVAASCSTAPKKPDSIVEVKNRAAEAGKSGDAYYRQGRYDVALRFYTDALQDNLSVDYREGVVQSYNSIGRVEMASELLDEARKSFDKARAIAEELGGVPLFVTRNNLGELSLRRGEAARALEIYQDLVKDPRPEIPPEQLALAYHNLAAAWKGSGDLDQAMSWLAKSLQINLDHKLYEEAAGDYYMIASLHSKRGELALARENAALALENDKRVENSLGIIKDLYALGLIEEKDRNLAAAYDYFQRSYLAATALGSAPEARQSLGALIEAAEALGMSAEAAEYRKTLAGLEGK